MPADVRADANPTYEAAFPEAAQPRPATRHHVDRRGYPGSCPAVVPAPVKQSDATAGQDPGSLHLATRRCFGRGRARRGGERCPSEAGAHRPPSVASTTRALATRGGAWCRGPAAKFAMVRVDRGVLSRVFARVRQGDLARSRAALCNVEW